MSIKSRLAKLEAASPASAEPKKIDTWQKLVDYVRDYSRVTEAEHIALEPFKKKFEDGVFTVKGAGSDFYAVLDILF